MKIPPKNKQLIIALFAIFLVFTIFVITGYKIGKNIALTGNLFLQ